MSEGAGISGRLLFLEDQVALKDKTEWEVETPAKSLRPAQCRAWMQRVLAKNYPTVVRRFLEDATPKSCGQMKMVTELLEADIKRPKRKRTGIDRLLSQYAAADAVARKKGWG